MATDDKVSVILTSTDTNGAVKQRSFTYISPDATNGQLKAFAQAANSLTDNTYNSSRKVTQVNLDTADPGQQKQTATVTLPTSSITLADLKNALKGSERFYMLNNITYDGDGQLLAYVSAGSSWLGVSMPFNNGNSYELNFYSGSNNIVDALTAPFTVTIRAEETANYTSAEATFTVTA